MSGAAKRAVMRRFAIAAPVLVALARPANAADVVARASIIASLLGR